MKRIDLATVRDVAARAGVSNDAAGKILAYLSLTGTVPAEPDLTYGDLVRRSVEEMRQHRARCSAAMTADSVPPAFPSHVQLQTISGCNASCVMCAMSMPQIRRLQRGRMDSDLFERIVTECADAEECTEIALYLQNEPLLDDELPARVRLIKERSGGTLATRIVTNGSLLTPDRADALIAAGLDSVAVSLNAHTAATYAAVMGGLSFETTMSNIEHLLTQAPSHMLVTLTFMATAVNQHEIEEAIGYWSERGVLCGAYGINTQAGALEGFEQLHVGPRVAGEKECYMPIESTAILCTGDVLLCCTDWQRNSIVGSLRERSLRDVWHSPALSAIRRDAIGGSLSHDICTTCHGQTRLPDNLMFERRL